MEQRAIGGLHSEISLPRLDYNGVVLDGTRTLFGILARI